MIQKFEDGESLSSVILILDFMASNVSTIVKDSAHIKEGFDRNNRHEVDDNNKDMHVMEKI